MQLLQYVRKMKETVVSQISKNLVASKHTELV